MDRAGPQPPSNQAEKDRRLLATCQLVEDCLGCRWSLHVLHELKAGVRRPGAIGRSLDGLSPKVLNQRLQSLQENGLVERRSFPEIPPRVEYTLTSLGEDLVAVLDRLEEVAIRVSR